MDPPRDLSNAGLHSALILAYGQTNIGAFYNIYLPIRPSTCALLYKTKYNTGRDSSVVLKTSQETLS